jgi:cytochrome b561
MQVSNSTTGIFTERRVAERRRNVSIGNTYASAGMPSSNNITPIHTERRSNIKIKMREASAHADAVWDTHSDISLIQVADTKPAKHSKATIILHWGTLLAIVIGVCAMFIREYIEEKTYRIGLLEVHRQLGMLVLVGVVLRLAVRNFVGLAKHSTPASLLTRLCSGICHLTLYALLIALPLLGWALSNAHNVDFSLFGITDLPRLVIDDSDLADELTEYHIWASWGLLGLVVMHMAAALIHHFVLKDNVLYAMLPGRRTKVQESGK